MTFNKGCALFQILHIKQEAFFDFNFSNEIPQIK